MITTKNIIEFLNSQEQFKELYVNEYVSFDFGPLELVLKINCTGGQYETQSRTHFDSAIIEDDFKLGLMEVSLSNESGDELNIGLTVKELEQIEKAFKGEALEIIKTEYFENL